MNADKVLSTLDPNGRPKPGADGGDGLKIVQRPAASSGDSVALLTEIEAAIAPSRMPRPPQAAPTAEGRSYEHRGLSRSLIQCIPIADHHEGLGIEEHLEFISWVARAMSIGARLPSTQPPPPSPA